MRNQCIVGALTGLVLSSLSVLAAAAVGGAPALAASEELIPRGRYVLGTAGGCACHTPPGAPGLNAGGQKFEGPFGQLHSPNITPDPETGIGRWTDGQVVDAIRRGERPDGRRLFPIHAYVHFGRIADDEAFALAAYLKSVKPVRHAVPAPALKVPVPAIPVPSPPKVAPTGGRARGEYLVKGASHCGDCHTPRRPDGSEDPAKFLAGTVRPGRVLMPNVTPHQRTGIGRWTEEAIARYLTKGLKPNGEQAASLMRDVIQGSSAGYKDLTPADALAVAQYLKTIPPIDRKVDQ